MKHEVHEPVGVEVTDVAIPSLGDDEVERVAGLLADHGVAVFRDQQMDDDDLEAFLRRFGDLVFTTGETPVDGHPDLNVISNVGRTTPPRSSFHVDSSYWATPPAYTALRAVSIPEQGGQTLFTNQYAAYDTLGDDWRALLAGRTLTHVVTGVELGEDDELEAEHPVFARHPLSRRTSLYLSTPQRCPFVSGMSAADSAEVVQHLYAHSTAESNTLRHAWRAGDVVMWDNRCVLHRADHSAVMGDRVMHRGMVAGHGPIEPADG